MSKYGSGMTTNSVCNLEIAECKEILERYNVSDADAEIITGIIKEAYFQLHQIAASGRALERIVDEIGDLPPREKFRMYMRLIEEERMRFPFDIFDDEEEENE